MLPRRHILDVWEFVKDEKELLSMATITLAVDAIKYAGARPGKDHLVDALELNEFICFMFPLQRPGNRALLFHVVSDLLGLLLYGVPRKSRQALTSLESTDYSEKNMEAYPVMGVWNHLKDKVYSKKHGAASIIEGFVKKIKIEMDTIERYPFIEDTFYRSKQCLAEWLPSFCGYYDKRAKSIIEAYDRWWSVWLCGEEEEKTLSGMIDRLSLQAEKTYGITIDKKTIFASVYSDRDGNRRENELFSHWFVEGVNLLLKI
jgi:hypothetical protein